MEKKLKQLFDYQRFEKNERLEALIRETENRSARELSDDEIEMVNAAGVIRRLAENERKLKDDGNGKPVL